MRSTTRVARDKPVTPVGVASVAATLGEDAVRALMGVDIPVGKKMVADVKVTVETRFVDKEE